MSTFNIQLPKIIPCDGRAIDVLEALEHIIDVPPQLEQEYSAYFTQAQEEHNKKTEQANTQKKHPIMMMRGAYRPDTPLKLIDYIEIGVIDQQDYIFLYSPYLEQRYLGAVDPQVVRIVLDHLQKTKPTDDWLAMEEIEDRWEWGYDIDEVILVNWKTQHENGLIISKIDTDKLNSAKRKM